MGRVEREAVFETNSSSTHSLSIKGGGYTPDPPFLRRDVELTAGEFGWGPERHTDTRTKASYILTAIMNMNPEEDEGREGYLDMLRRVILVQARSLTLKGCTPPDSYGGTGWGHIDHQSEDVAFEALASETALRDFLFNPASVLIIDHDNH